MGNQKHINTIILCAGPIILTNLPISTNQSNAMVPVNGKPVIGWILDDLRAKNIKSVTIVLQEKDQRLAMFLSWAYAKRIDIKLVYVDENGSIVESLHRGLTADPENSSTRVILGDTLIYDSYESDQDFVYVGPVEDSHHWCIAELDATMKVYCYHDKKDLPGNSFFALSGYYHFIDSDWLLKCVKDCIAAGTKELSDVLVRYSAKRPIFARVVKDWFDFGHIENLVDARRKMLQPRSFNVLTINPVLNTITKVSARTEKLQDELDWYCMLPKPLQVLTPRILESQPVNGCLEIVQEYYGYPTLAELYLYGDLHPGIWNSILKHLLRIYAEFKKYPAVIAPLDAERVYIDKTEERVEELKHQSRFWNSFLNEERIFYNGRFLYNFEFLKPEIIKYACRMASSVNGCVIHGDFCFSNILFDLNNQIVRLIDPRGSFGKKGIYGDPRYDMAKLHHSVSGLYDYMVADLFELNETKEGYIGVIFANQVQPLVSQYLDQLLCEHGYDLREIRFIEGLLFVSMPSLHSDHFKRQLIMYLTGLTLLNEVLYENCN